MDASKLIDQKIASLADWRGKRLAEIRQLIRSVDAGIIEEWKWMGTPVWSHNGLICTGESYKAVVKMTFPKGATLKDPAGLFNSSLEGNARRAIDIHEGETIDADALKSLIRDAIALNAKKPAARKPDAKSTVSGYLPGTKTPASGAKTARAANKPPAKKKLTTKTTKPRAKSKSKSARR